MPVESSPSGHFPNEAKQMLTEIRKLTTLPIRYVVNTHYHLDPGYRRGVERQEENPAGRNGKVPRLRTSNSVTARRCAV
jgi:hypothetical protein